MAIMERSKEAIRTEFESLIIKNEVFETVDYKDIPAEMRNKINPLLILLKRKRNQFQEFTKYKCKLVLDGSKAKVMYSIHML